MPKKPKYRLQVLLIIKEKAKKQAEIALSKALRRLEEEKRALKRLEAERDAVIRRIEQERAKMVAKVAAGDALVKDPQVHLNFVRKLKEDLEELELRIELQKEAVKRAEQHVQRCRRDYILAAQELNTMEKHKELWEKKQQAALSALENKLMNELGNVVFQMNRGK